jgi:hypothetical protein
LWVVMFLLLQVGLPVAGGFLLVRFLQRSRLAAFGWGLALVMLTVPVTVAVVTTWVRPM